jgi:uncharacterized paraquat-inducible protein A
MEEMEVPTASESATAFSAVCILVTSWKIFLAVVTFVAVFCVVRAKIRKKKRGNDAECHRINYDTKL